MDILMLGEPGRTHPAGVAAMPATKPEGAFRAPTISLFFLSADQDECAADTCAVVLDCAELADQIGLHAIWVPERHFDAAGAAYPSPAVLLAAIAAQTSRIRLRAGSLVLPLRDPLLVAEEWGMLDALSRGRAGLAVGEGRRAEDFVLNPDAFHRRDEELRERLETVRRLWQGERIIRPGPAGHLEVGAHPLPRRPPEMWLNVSEGRSGWLTAGELNLHVLTALSGQDVAGLAAMVELYGQTLAAAGHPVHGHEITAVLHTHIAADPRTVPDRVKVLPGHVNAAGLFGGVDSCLPLVGRLAAAGVTELACLVDFGLPADQVLECVEELGKLQTRLWAAAADSR